MIPVFDGHNDFLLRLHTNPGKREAIWSGAESGGHLDLQRMKAGGFVGGFFAVFVPPTGPVDFASFDAMLSDPPYDLPLPEQMDHKAAMAPALDMVSHLIALERTGDLSICRSVVEIDAAMTESRIAAILHMEGAEAIDPDLDSLYAFHAMGLRSLGPVWSRPTAFGHGVPFRYPGAPDTGPGLTDAGKRLVRACNDLGIMIDLSHLNGKGFDDVAALSDAPLVATHSNAHAVTPSTRNLTDRQLQMIRDSDGMVGLNFATVFLREDGKQEAATGWDPILRHLDHLIGVLGEDRVGFGSDFDGATVPEVIGDVAGMPAMIEALRQHGYDDALLTKLAHANWLALLRRTWKTAP
ncbi:dipeptidase [Flavimaricola marinus]|uniref:Membrane dipeptidase (Peptidase family M19) n=1 Tax=Flavimaricola marinus TaxID=1819565 RepID=A0A238LCE7_9RHOB|nr:dipeptidase [Flavimaricola marinus]SMY07085.1 Membrane dipeptidase (Peptidase family M19) [Flavimaricola marinus]